MASRAEKRIVIGVGNECRGDDAVGLLVARRLRARALPGVEIVECSGDATLLLEAWAGADSVWLVDAVSSGARPGSCFRLDALGSFPAEPKLRYSTHGLGVEQAVELARALNRLPRQLIIYGIEAAGFAVGAAVCKEAMLGAERAMEAIIQELGMEKDTGQHA